MAAGAAIFTGRKLNREYPFAPYLNARQVDDSTNLFWGGIANISGDEQGYRAFAVIFAELQGAYHTCWKLWLYFVHANPEETLLQRLASRLKNRYDYDLKAILQDIFVSEEFHDQQNMGGQIKDVADFLISILKTLEMSLFPPSLQGWPEPNGERNAWLATGPMLFRINLSGLWSPENFGMFVNARSRRKLADYPEPAKMIVVFVRGDVIETDLGLIIKPGEAARCPANADLYKIESGRVGANIPAASGFTESSSYHALHEIVGMPKALNLAHAVDHTEGTLE